MRITFYIESQEMFSYKELRQFEQLMSKVGFTSVFVYGVSVGGPGERELCFELEGPGAYAEVVDED